MACEGAPGIDRRSGIDALIETAADLAGHLPGLGANQVADINVAVVTVEHVLRKYARPGPTQRQRAPVAGSPLRGRISLHQGELLAKVVGGARIQPYRHRTRCTARRHHSRSCACRDRTGAKPQDRAEVVWDVASETDRDAVMIGANGDRFDFAAGDAVAARIV